MCFLYNRSTCVATVLPITMFTKDIFSPPKKTTFDQGKHYHCSTAFFWAYIHNYSHYLTTRKDYWAEIKECDRRTPVKKLSDNQTPSTPQNLDINKGDWRPLSPKRNSPLKPGQGPEANHKEHPSYKYGHEQGPLSKTAKR